LISEHGLSLHQYALTTYKYMAPADPLPFPHCCLSCHVCQQCLTFDVFESPPI